MGKFARTWQLMGASWQLLKQDKRLVIFPLLSGIALMLVVISFAAPLFSADAQHYLNSADRNDPIIYLFMFLFYFACYFVLIFFNSALIACVLKQMNGEQPTVGYGLRFSWQRLPQIFGWALLTGTVGFVLRLIEQRVGLIGRIVVRILGMAWAVTSFLVVPVLVAEGKGPIDAYKQSVLMFKRTWGEQLIGNVSFGLIFFLFGVIPPVIAILIGLFVSPVTLLVLAPLTVIWLLTLALVQSTLQAIYQAAVYRYAADGEAPGGFDKQLIADAFRVKQPKSWM